MENLQKTIKSLDELENEYAKIHKGEYFIFPDYWEEGEEEEKKKVLIRAIKEKKLIRDVKGGSQFVEGIH